MAIWLTSLRTLTPQEATWFMDIPFANSACGAEGACRAVVIPKKKWGDAIFLSQKLFFGLPLDIKILEMTCEKMFTKAVFLIILYN